MRKHYWWQTLTLFSLLAIDMIVLNFAIANGESKIYVIVTTIIIGVILYFVIFAIFWRWLRLLQKPKLLALLTFVYPILPLAIIAYLHFKQSKASNA